MAKRNRKAYNPSPDQPLKGWQQIAAFLGQPISVAQKWSKTGMPVARQGRFITSTREELNDWLGRDSGVPVRVATAETDLSAELKRGLSYVRQDRRPIQNHKKQKKR